MNVKRNRILLDAQLGKIDAFMVLTDTRNWNSEDSKKALDELLGKKTKSCTRLRESFLPKDYSSLCQDKRFGRWIDIQLNNLLSWYVNVINHFVDEINVYIKLKKEYLSFLLRGEYDKASDSLNIIKSYGYSLWSLENEFVLAEYQSSVEENKAFLASIENEDNNIWISVFASFFSFKAEKSISNRQYVYRISRMVEGIGKDITAFIEEKMFPIYSIKFEDIFPILRFNSSCSIFDIYDTLVKLSVRVSVDNSIDSEYKAIFLRSILSINGIDDPVLKKLLLSEKNYSLTVLDRKMLDIGNIYTRGDYASTKDRCIDLFNSGENCFEIAEYYSKAAVLSDDNAICVFGGTILGDLLNAMFYSYSRGNSIDKVSNDLFRIERITSNFGFGSSLADFIIDKYTVSYFDLIHVAKDYFSPFLNARLIIAENNNIKKNSVLKILGDNLNSRFVSSIGDLGKLSQIEEVEDNRLRWYQVIALKDNYKKIDQLKEWQEELALTRNKPSNKYYWERISTKLFYLYLKEDKVVEAEQLYVNCYSVNKFSVLRMDLRQIPFHSNNKSVKKAIETPIVTFLINSNDYGEIFSATANFLDSNGFSKPSDMFSVYDKFDFNSFKFFMHKVCKREILDSLYDVLESDDEVSEERLKICRMLQKLDSGNSLVYIDEISSIIKNKKILQGMNYLDKVKINLDIHRVIDEHRSLFEENINRFIEIENLDVEYRAIDIPKQLVYISETTNKEKYSHKLNIFIEIISDFQHELAFGKFGLDQTLGTRIRHGSLQNQIRVVFERNNIILVKRNIDDKEYINYDFSANKFESLNKFDSQLIQRAFSEFSKEIDEYIIEIKEQNIQIRIGELHPNGIIDLTVDMEDLVNLFEAAQKITNSNLMLEALEEFWIIKINDNLDAARRYISTIIKQKFVEMIDNLERKIKRVESFNARNQLLSSITMCRTEIQSTIDSITNWFKLPTQNVYPPFDLQSFVDTCIGINKQIFSNYNEITVDTSIDSHDSIKGEYFSYLVDILIILFTNAYSHSGYLSDLSKLHISLNISETEDKIVFEMTNNLSDSVDKKGITKKINEIQNKIQDMLVNGEYQNYEGGSGFVKICKILQWDIEKEWNMEFGMDDSEQLFFVTLNILKDGFIFREE